MGNTKRNDRKEGCSFPFGLEERRVEGAGAGFSRMGIIIALLFFIILGGIGWSFLSSSGAGPEQAIPKVYVSSQVFVKIENPENFKNKLEKKASLLGDMQNTMSLPDAYVRMLDKREGFVEWVGGLLGSAENAAFLIAGDSEDKANDGLFYLSFIPKESAFNKLISNSDDSAFLVEKWEQDKGDEGWIVKPSLKLANAFEKLPSLYLLKTSSKKGAPILVSDKPDNIDQMQKALKSGSSRLTIKRHNSAPDFVQVKHPIKTREGETKITTSEIAWIEDDTSAHAQFYTDVFSLITGRAVPKSGLRGDVPILGNGSLVFVAGVDIPYACFSAYPMDADPVAKVLKDLTSFSPFPFPYKDELHKIMSEGRISVVVVQGEGDDTDYSTVYFVLESKAKDAMEKLVSLPKSLMQKSSLNGWDSCYTVDAGGKLKVLFAQRGDIVMIGLGSPESYSKKASIPAEIKDFSAPQDLANMVATPSFWEIASASSNPLAKTGIEKIIRALEIEPCTIQLRVVTPEKSDIGFYWAKPNK